MSVEVWFEVNGYAFITSPAPTVKLAGVRLFAMTECGTAGAFNQLQRAEILDRGLLSPVPPMGWSWPIAEKLGLRAPVGYLCNGPAVYESPVPQAAWIVVAPRRLD